MRFAALSLVLVLMGIPTVSAAELSPGGSFVDDDGSVHEGTIEAIAELGVTKGCNPPFNDEFCPRSAVTRGQMAAFLRRAFAGSIPETEPEITFVDVAGSPFVDDIAWLSRTGITKGCGSAAAETFCPQRSVTRGQMAAFLVRALGLTDRGSIDFIDDDDSIFEADIEKLFTAGITTGCNPPDPDRFCPDDAVRRDQMASFLARALDLTPIVPPARGDLTLERVGGTFAQPIYVTAPAGDDRLFVVEKGGKIKIVDGGSATSTFLDLTPLVFNSGEKGLLSMAFHPEYASNGRFYVYYSGVRSASTPASWDHTSFIVEYQVSANPDVADPGSRRVVLEVGQHYPNHNGGHLLFGPDGMLYVALGDGGGGGDPDENGQNTGTLPGSILRLDVDGGTPYGIPSDSPFVGRAGEDEIWLYGVRNPWRIWFDDGSLYVADVGQNSREEITVVDASSGGLNLGWDVLEGTRCYEPSSGCSSSGTVLPALEYTHSEGCSITGGVVYRGSVTQLRDWYLYSDLCGGWIRAARFVDGTLAYERDLTGALNPPGGAWSFGVDGEGEVYVVYGNAGAVYRITEN